MEYRPITEASLAEPILDRMEELELCCGQEPYSRDMLRRCVESLETLGAFEGELLVGFLTMGWTSIYCGGSLYIVNRNVAPEYRGRGIAKRLLLTKLGELYRLFPGKMVSLDVAWTNRAMKLYEKLGFRQIDPPSRNGPKDVVMAANLEYVLECLSRLMKEG